MSLTEIHSTTSGPLTGRITPLAFYAGATVLMASAIVLGFAAGVSEWSFGAVLALPLITLTALWISGGAATGLLGLLTASPRAIPVPEAWTPSERTAILVTVCGENPVPIATHLRALRRSLDTSGTGDATQIFVLSDTSRDDQIATEEAAFAPLQQAGVLRYRRRAINTGRKPGNIGDWFQTHSDAFGYMMVLDADSQMSAHRIRRMIWQIERQPRVGLLQAGIALIPGTTRFGRHQRVASRVLSRNFGRGFAAWTGESGNYWGHNAIMRTAAFRDAVLLPTLSGAAPFGGDILSHDFIEAAWMRRAGWAIALDPDPVGSAESAPQTLGEFHRRDRRWCQGNLQHLRLLFTPGLCPISRVHLAAGILSYLAAPLWLMLVGLIASGLVPVSGVVPLLLVAFVLILPKLCAMIDWLGRTRTLRRRMVAMRALVGELIVSSLIAPLVMVRHAGAVVSVCLGRDCGWKSGRARRFYVPDGLPEMAVGGTLILLAWATTGSVTLWLAPVVMPLCAAPVIARVLNASA
ncbi:glucans biosynthesis glucosyltransferase MdoH [Cognatishimia sp. MH4019]|uniref:glucans biosynthesis glucosyltransferase MdoH n=1 Tax=Cognatishimia sp. MH4019 TaxID=2854030 RepID=UPI001CD531DA|nr:glucans biosynthesis glucosyltransferase MdoH [Cognatishimia sp. MH4019]